ncbi:MAG: YfhO family protein [Bacteroidales bacterium]|nr:YfhO family protein [Bacteroidales bacterium]
MDFKQILKKAGPDALIVLLFLLVSIIYFHTPLSQGLVLGGHDSVAAVGLSREQTDFGQSHDGEVSRWSNALFSGMPTYQTAPSYGATDVVSNLSHIYALGTTGWFPAIGYVFLYLLGFYILLRAFRMKPYVSALGAVLWAFSSYFLIIIAAGHLWKVMALGFIPPTIAGLVLCYRGRLLWGGAVTALFTAFQVMANHMQMTYYFLFVMALLVVAYLVDAVCTKRLAAWAKGTLTLVLAGLLGVATCLPNIYHTYAYAKESMRGKAELTPLPSAKGTAATDGLDRDYITAWSYGIDETLTLLIPDFKGGGSASILDHEGVESLPGYDDFYECAGMTQQALAEKGMQQSLPGISQYWGDQPFTVGPVYVGALVCFLFVLGIFYVKGPVKWGLLAATLVSLLFAWGKNSPDLTNFFIDHLPLYSKFRTVSSALVMAEFTMPLLAILCLCSIMADRRLFDLTHWRGADVPRRKRIGLPMAAALTLGLCLLLWLMPEVAGSCLSADDSRVFQLMSQTGMPSEFTQRYMHAITAMHHAILSASALRSALFIVAGVLILTLYARQMLKGWMMCSLLSLLGLFDLWGIDKRYLNDESFSDPYVQQETFAKTPADEQILQDTTYYRVVNVGAGNPFNETTNATGYYHHSIGGYHAAKLHRYQDLIDRMLLPELQRSVGAISDAQGDMSMVAGDSIMPALNMLNTKYFIFGQGARAQAIPNPYANGNAWFVQQLNFVENADAEMAALQKLDTKRAAVADARFKPALQTAVLDSGTVRLTHYDTNLLRYVAESPKGGVVVFSEVYYPDWTVTIDGKPAELGRVNYLLRALRVPAGRHEIDMEFRPASVATTDRLGYAAIALTLLLFGAALVWPAVRKRSHKAQQA